jgi:hypothetical protein
MNNELQSQLDMQQPATLEVAQVATPDVSVQETPDVAQQPIVDAPSAVALPTGYKDKIADFLLSKDQSPEATAKLLEGLDPVVAEKVKSALNGDDVDFVEKDLVADENLTDDDFANLPPKVSTALEQLLGELEESKQNQITPDIERVLLHPLVKASVEAITTGTQIKVPNFDEAITSAGIDPNALFEKIQDLFETIGEEGNARNLIQEAFTLAISNAVNAVRANTIADLEVKQQQQLEQQRIATFYDSGIEKLASGVQTKEPLMKDGAYNMAHPIYGFIKEMYEGYSTGEIPYGVVAKMGIDGMYQAWRTRQAGGVGAYIGQTKLSIAEQMKNVLNKQKNNALRSIQAHNPGAMATDSSARIIVNGVDIARAYTDRSYASDIARTVTGTKLVEVNDALKKYASSLTR